MHSNRSPRSNSTIKEEGIFIFLTLVIFFVAVGFPTLINTSPTIGYDDNTIAKLTPVTTFYQEAYAEQQAMNILSKYYYEPIMASAFLVMPIAIDNLPPPDPVQYFLLKYSQGIEPEFGFIEFGQVQEFFEPIVNELLNFEFLPEAFAEVFPFTATSHSRMSRSLGITGTACSLIGISNTADDDIRVEDADPSASCNDLGLEWDISSIPDGSTITDIQFRFDTSSPTVSRACEIKPMQFQPSTASSQTLIDDIENGTAFIASTTTCQFTLTDNQLDLGTSADADLEANLVDDWWAIGMSYVDETRDSASLHDVVITSGRIQVTYIPPAPVVPTGLTVTQDLAPYAILDWDDVATALSYNIYWDHNQHTSDFILIANVPNSDYVDKRVPYHKQNCLSNALLCDKYKVSAVNGGGESSNSTTVDFGLYIPTRTSEVLNFRTNPLIGFVQYFQARWIFDSNWNSSPNFIGSATSLDVYYRLGSNETDIHITNDTISNVGTFTTNGNDIFGQKVTVPAMNLTRIIQKFDFNSAFPTAGNITAFVWNSTNGFIDVSNDTVHFPTSADLKDVTTCEVTGCDSVRDQTFFFPTQVPLSAGEYVFGLRHEGVTSTGTHGQGVISSDVDSGVRVSDSDWTNGITFVEDVGSDSNIQIIGIADGWIFCQNTGSDDDDVNCPPVAQRPLANGTEVWIQAFVDVAGQRSAIVPISSFSTRELGFTPAGTGINASAIVGGSSFLLDTGIDGGFVAEFEINFTSFPVSPRALPLAFSDKNQDIDGDTNDNDILAVMARNNGVNDGLRILFVDNGDATSGGCGVELCLSAGIDLLIDTVYYPRLERHNATVAELSVFTDNERTTHVSGSPVTAIINATIDGLQFVHSQHMSSNTQSTIGTIDNLIIVDSSNSFSDNFSTNSSWTQTGTGVTIANGQVEGWTAFAGDQRITHDLGFILDEGDISIPPTAPASITTLNATQINSIFLQWIEPDDGGSPITGYEIERTRTDIARNGTYMDFLFREHEISGEIDALDTTDEVILSASEGFVGQAFNVTSNEEVGAIAVSFHRITTTACTGSAFLQGTIFFDNATRVENSTNTFSVCSVAPNTPPVITEDHVFIFNNTEIFTGNEYVFGVEKIGTNSDGDIDIPLSTVRTTLAEGFSVRDFSSPPFVFTNDTSTDTAVSVFILNFTTLVADTGNTNTNFTDTTCPAGITCYYRAQGINAIGTAGKSNIANATETGLETIFNATSNVNNIWSYRSHDDEYSAGTGTGGTCTGFAGLFNCGGVPDTDFETAQVSGFDHRPKMSATFGATSNTPQAQGNGYIFKTFTRNAILNQNLTVAWELVEAGGNDRPMQIQVYDGAYIAENNEDFPYNNAIKLKGGGLLGFCSTQIGGTDKPVHLTECLDGIDGNDRFGVIDIDYSLSTEDFITVFIQQQPITLSIADLYLNNMTITNVAFWDFINAGVTNTRGLFNDTRDLQFSQKAGFYTGNATILVTPPVPITDLQVTLGNTTEIWDATGVTSGGFFGFDPDFPRLIVQTIPTQTIPVLIDSMRMTFANTGGVNADPDGVLKAVIVGDRTGDLDTNSKLSDMYFIENSTQTVSTLGLANGDTVFIFNFSGNTILDSGDAKVAIGYFISTDDRDSGDWDLTAFGNQAGQLAGGHALMMNQQNGASCIGQIDTFERFLCVDGNTDVLRDLEIFGGNGRAILNWTQPVGSPTGYEIVRANATQQILYDEEVELSSFCVLVPSDGRCETIGTLADPLGFVGQRITFPTDVQLTNLMLNLGYNDNFPFNDGTIDIQGVILKDAPVGTGSFTRVANSTFVKIGETVAGDVTGGNAHQFNTFSNCCPEAFTFNNTILTAGVEYIIGVESFGTFSGTDIFQISHNATASGTETAPNNGLGVFTKLHVGTSDLWVNNSTQNLNAMFMGLNYTEEVANTGNTNVEYTSTADFPSADGKINAYRYLVKGINAGGNANASNTAEISPDRTGFDLWDYMEHDTREFFTSNCTFETNEEGVFAMNYTGISVGFCYLFKSFDKTEITGSDIGININFTDFGRVLFSAIDGSYDKDDFADFPVNSPFPNIIVANPIKGIGFLNNTDSEFIGLDQCDIAGSTLGLRQCDVVIPASDINYAGSTENQITVFLRLFAGSTAVGNVEISNVGSWDFKNSPRKVIGINNGAFQTFSLGASNNQDDRGNVYSNGIVQGNVTVLVPEQVTGLNITQNMNNNATLDWNDALNADNYQVLRKVNFTEAEVNTNSTWSFRAFRSGSVGIDATCQVLNSGSGATGGILLKNTDSGDDANCNFWKFFPRDFLNNTRIQFSYTLTHIFGSQFLTRTLVGTENDPQANRFDDVPPNSIGYGTSVPDWTGGTSNDGINPRVNIDTNTVAITTVQTTDEFVDVQANWDKADSDYVSLVFQTNDLSLATSQPTLKIFWINITDFDTLEQKAFYNFSGNTRVTERSGNCDSGAPSTCGFGRFDAGTTIITTESFEEIGTPITSDFEDSTLPITGVSTYKVRGNNTVGFGQNSTEVDFGLIQEIDGITDIGGGLFTGSLNATALNSTAVKLTWDQASTEHPTDPLTGVIIQRSNQTNHNVINGTWQFREYDDAGGTTPNCVWAQSGVTDSLFMFMSGTSTHAGHCNIFKILPTHLINNTKVFVDWESQIVAPNSGIAKLGYSNSAVFRDPDSVNSFPIIAGLNSVQPAVMISGKPVGFVIPTELTKSLSSGFARTIDVYSPTPTEYASLTSNGYSTLYVELVEFDGTNNPDIVIHSINITDSLDNELIFWNFTDLRPFGSVRVTESTTNFFAHGTIDVTQATTVPNDLDFRFDETNINFDSTGGMFETITTVDDLDTMFTDTVLESNLGYTYRAKGQSAVSTGAFGDNNTATTISALNVTQTETDTVTTSDEQKFNITNAEIDISVVVDQTVLISPPFPITTLVGSTVGDTCQLTWSAPPNGGSPITEFQIFRSVAGSAFITLLNQSFTDHTDTFLVNNVLYEYNVTSTNAFGNSESSNIVDCMPVVSAVPTAPTNIQAVEEPSGDVTLTWSEPSAGDPTGYQIQRKIENGGFLILVNDTATPALIFLDTATDPSVEYTWRVAGWNSLGLGAFSNPVTLRMSSPPDAPILSGAQNGDQIEISWIAPTSANPITGYKIDKRINLGAFFILIANTTTPSVLNFTDTNVTKPDTFGYRVRALSSAGEGTVSNVVDIVFGSHLIVHVREQDGSGFKGGGIVRGFNSTFSDLIGLDVNSDSTFDNLAVANYNFTFFDDDNFILNKTFNFPAPAGNLTSEFTINALVFDVDCPDNGAGTDVRIKVNYTDAKDITEFPSTPVCDSTDQVSWSTRWQGSAVNDTSTMIADFISTVFKANAEQFLASADIIPTIYNAGENQIESNTYVVNMTDVTINFNLFLGRAPSGGGAPSPSPSNPAQPTPSIPDPDVVFEQRLTGLSLLSRTHQFAQAGDVIEGSVTVNWEGEINLDVRAIDTSKTDLDIRFDLPPFPLDQRIEGIGEFAMSTADIRYTIVLPADECNPEIGLTQNCFDPTLHTIPLEFEFERDNQVYEASTEVFVDGRPIPLDIVQLQIILLFLVLIASAVFGRFIRNRARGSTRRTKTKKKKFKKKFDSS